MWNQNQNQNFNQFANSERLSRDELELEDHGDHIIVGAEHDHAEAGAANDEVLFLDEDEASEFFLQEKQLLSFLQNP